MRFWPLYLCLLPGLLAAQAPAPPDPAPAATTFRSDARLVVLHVTVTDKDGKLINGLPQSVFKVAENSVPQEITVFRQEDAPVSFGLVIDNSASMRDMRSHVEAAALGLIKASNPDDEAFVVNFNEHATLDQEFTGDLKILERGLRRLDSKGETAMRDAAELAVTHLREHGAKDKKVLFIITDGADNSSIVSLAQVIRAAQRSGIQVYAIGLLAAEEPRDVRMAHRALDSLTADTGGLAYYPESVEEVDAIVQKVAKDIRNQYTVGYRPTNQAQDATFRQLRVDVKSPNVGQVRYRSGYWANGELTAPNSAEASIPHP